MKKIFLSILFLYVFVANAQTPIFRSQQTVTPVDYNGKFKQALAIPVFAHLPSLGGGLDSLGSICYVEDSNAVFVRDTVLSGGHRWTKVGGSGSGGAGWLLTGNAGTTSGTNFLGTTDNQDLVFKRNNVVSGLLNNVLGNTSFGVNAFNLANSGFLNTAVGWHSLMGNTAGSYNSAFGEVALSSNTTGSENTGIGYDALLNSVGNSFNTAIGGEAGISLITGTGNTFLGWHANNIVDSPVNYSIALGYNANVGSRQFSISDSIINIKADLNGQVAGYVLTTDGNVATWQPSGTGGSPTFQQVLNNGNTQNRNDSVIGATHDFIFSGQNDFKVIATNDIGETSSSGNLFRKSVSGNVTDTAFNLLDLFSGGTAIFETSAANGLQLNADGSLLLATQGTGLMDLSSSGNINLSFGASGTLLLNNVAGTAGQVPTSQGAGLPLIWGSGGGGGGINIYNTDSLLAGDRIVDDNHHTLTFSNVNTFNLDAQGFNVFLIDSLGQEFGGSTDGVTVNTTYSRFADGTWFHSLISGGNVFAGFSSDHTGNYRWDINNEVNLTHQMKFDGGVFHLYQYAGDNDYLKVDPEFDQAFELNYATTGTRILNDYYPTGELTVYNTSGSTQTHSLDFSGGDLALTDIGSGVKYYDFNNLSVTFKDITTGSQVFNQSLSDGSGAFDVINSGNNFGAIGWSTNGTINFINNDGSNQTFRMRFASGALQLSDLSSNAYLSASSSSFEIDDPATSNQVFFVNPSTGNINGFDNSTGTNIQDFNLDNGGIGFFAVNNGSASYNAIQWEGYQLPVDLRPSTLNITGQDASTTLVNITQASGSTQNSLVIQRTGFGVFTTIDNAGNLNTNSYTQPVFSNSTVVADNTGKFVSGGLQGQFTTIQDAAPSAGDNVISDGSPDLVLNPSGTLLTLTVTFPASPTNGQLFSIECTQIVSTLTLDGNGNTILGGIASFAANGFVGYVYDADLSDWVRRN